MRGWPQGLLCARCAHLRPPAFRPTLPSVDRHMAETAYDSFADLYDDYVGGFDDDIPFWTSVVDADTSVVEIGCGTGRVMAALAGRAATVTGVDISTRMLTIAEQRLAAAIADGRASLLNHDLASGPLPRLFDVAILTFYTFNYVTEYPDVFLRNVFLSLAPGGLIAMDLFCPLPLQKPELDGVSRTRSITCSGQRVGLTDTRFMRDGLEVRTQVYHLPSGDRAIVTNRRYYDPDEIELMLSATGFTNHRFASMYDFTNLNSLQCLPRTDTSFIVKSRRP